MYLLYVRVDVRQELNPRCKLVTHPPTSQSTTASETRNYKLFISLAVEPSSLLHPTPQPTRGLYQSMCAYIIVVRNHSLISMRNRQSKQTTTLRVHYCRTDVFGFVLYLGLPYIILSDFLKIVTYYEIRIFSNDLPSLLKQVSVLVKLLF